MWHRTGRNRRVRHRRLRPVQLWNGGPRVDSATPAARQPEHAGEPRDACLRGHPLLRRNRRQLRRASAAASGGPKRPTHMAVRLDRPGVVVSTKRARRWGIVVPIGVLGLVLLAPLAALLATTWVLGWK